MADITGSKNIKNEPGINAKDYYDYYINYAIAYLSNDTISFSATAYIWYDATYAKNPNGTLTVSAKNFFATLDGSSVADHITFKNPAIKKGNTRYEWFTCKFDSISLKDAERTLKIGAEDFVFSQTVNGYSDSYGCSYPDKQLYVTIKIPTKADLAYKTYYNGETKWLNETYEYKPGNQTVLITNSVPNNPPCEFKGWTSDSYSNAVEFNSGDSYTYNGLSAYIASSKILYAVWKNTYEKPRLTVSAVRVDSSGQETSNDKATRIKARAIWLIDSKWLTGAKKLTAELLNPDSKAVIETKIINDETITSNISYVSDVMFDSITSIDVAYDVRVTITDKYGSGSNTDSLRVPDYIFDVSRETGNVGVGGPADPDYKLRVRGNLIADNFKDVKQAYPVGAIYMSVNPTSPASLFGGKWEQLRDTFLYASDYKLNADGSVETKGSYAVNSEVSTSTGGSKDAVAVSHSHSVNAVNTGNNKTNHVHYGTTDGISANHRHYTGGKSNNGTGTTGSGPNFTNGVLITEDWGWKHLTNWVSSGHTHNFSTGAQSADHAHTVPAHNTNSAGESGVGKNMPPYLPVYMWKKIAEDDGTTMTITGNLGAMEAKGYMDQASTSAANAKKYYDNLVSTSMATYQATLYSVTVATGDWTSTNGSYVATKSISGIKSTSKLKSLDLASDQVSSNYASAAESGYAMIVSAETLDGSIKFTAHSKPTVELHLEALIWNK